MSYTPLIEPCWTDGVCPLSASQRHFCVFRRASCPDVFRHPFNLLAYLSNRKPSTILAHPAAIPFPCTWNSTSSNQGRQNQTRWITYGATYRLGHFWVDGAGENGEFVRATGGEGWLGWQWWKSSTWVVNGNSCTVAGGGGWVVIDRGNPSGQQIRSHDPVFDHF